MLINEVSKTTALTKKAIEYYMEQDLVCPDILENGYREFHQDHVKVLSKISVLRKLGLSIEDIKSVLSDETGSVLHKLSIKKTLHIGREQLKKDMLDKLACSEGYDEIQKELKANEQTATITEKLLDAFPGCYGRFICLHFARFLNDPITGLAQREAYQEIINFLDNVPKLYMPKELQEYLGKCTKEISNENIRFIITRTKESIENPETFLKENKDVMEQYLAYKQSDEYKNSPVCTLQRILKEFNSTSGYYDIFIPAMKKISNSYAEYYRQIEIANEKLLSQYPEIAQWS